jgi:hypothetical protein
MLMPIMISMTRSYHNSKLFCRFESVLSHNSAIFFTSVLFLLFISITSCEENPTIIGSDLLPATDFVNIKSTDTIGVAAYSYYTDSIITNNRSYSYLGTLYDPYFGTTKTDFVGQLRMYGPNSTGVSGPWPGGGTPIVDSVLLYFSIAGAKGTLDSTTIHQIKIFEIDETLNSTVKYYSNHVPKIKKEIGTFSLPVITKDTIQGITIELPAQFGQDLLSDTTQLLQDSEGNPFKSFFKGLYLTMDSTISPLFLIALDFSSPDFTIRVYYSTSKASNLSYDFVINTNSVRYNRYSHNFASADPVKKIKHINDGVKDSSIYLQSFNGVFPQVRIPGLTSIKKMLVDSVTNVCHGSINKARLTFSVYLDDNLYTTTTVPPQILMKYNKSDTIQYLVPDYYVSASFFDGTFNSTSKTYSFNLASFVQEYLEGRISDPVVEMYYPEGEYKNVILKANNSHSPVKFEFTYTRF